MRAIPPVIVPALGLAEFAGSAIEHGLALGFTLQSLQFMVVERM